MGQKSPDPNQHGQVSAKQSKNILKKRKKNAALPESRPAVLLLPHILSINSTQSPLFRNDMDNIQNTRGKGFCLMYLFMFLFFLTAVILMLYSRSGMVDFPR